MLNSCIQEMLRKLEISLRTTTEGKCTRERTARQIHTWRLSTRTGFQKNVLRYRASFPHLSARHSSSTSLVRILIFSMTTSLVKSFTLVKSSHHHQTYIGVHRYRTEALRSLSTANRFRSRSNLLLWWICWSRSTRL